MAAGGRGNRSTSLLLAVCDASMPPDLERARDFEAIRRPCCTWVASASPRSCVVIRLISARILSSATFPCTEVSAVVTCRRLPSGKDDASGLCMRGTVYPGSAGRACADQNGPPRKLATPAPDSRKLSATPLLRPPAVAAASCGLRAGQPGAGAAIAAAGRRSRGRGNSGWPIRHKPARYVASTAAFVPTLSRVVANCGASPYFR